MGFDQAAVVIRTPEAVLFESYRGLGNLATGIPIDARTRFQIASISKTFTATAVLRLVDCGALTLHDPVSRWLPAAPSAWQRITIHHLLTHTAGLGHWPSYPELDLLRPIDPADEIAIFQSHSLRFEPGTDWSYSSPGYVLLAYLVEYSAGEPYRKFLGDRILRAAGLEHTFSGSGANEPMRAAGYEQGQPAAPFELDTVGRGTGDLWSTAGDLAQWMSLLAGPSLLPPALRHRMLFPHNSTAADDSNPVPHTHYGYGISLGHHEDDALLFHTGHNPGFRAVAGFFPHRGAAFAYLSNEETADLGAVMRQIGRIAASDREAA